MIFAFVMSRFLYQLARSGLEKGVSLGTLEQLMGSSTLGSTFKIHLELRTLNILGLTLLCAWSLSPLGGQSLLRILHEGTLSKTTVVAYADTVNEGQRLSFFADATYFSSIFSPTTIKEGPEDLWGNVKIPFLHKTPTRGGEEWTEIDYPRDKPIFSSLVGIPVTNTSIGNSTFSIESTYISLSCDKLNKTRLSWSYVPTMGEVFLDSEAPLRDMYNTTFANGSWYGSQHPYTTNDESGYYFIWWSLGLDRFVDEIWTENLTALEGRNPLSLFENFTSEDVQPANLLFQARSVTELSNGTRLDLYQTECRVLQNYIESRVRCDQRLRTETPSRTCQVISQRLSQHPHPPRDNFYSFTSKRIRHVIKKHSLGFSQD